MVSPENRLSYPLDGLPGSVREQQRLLALTELGLLEAESVPVFEEATQTAAHFLDLPICILGLMDQDRECIKSAVGLSRLGLMNELAATRQIPRSESFCIHVVDSLRALVIQDASTDPEFANSFLVKRYGIRAYLGVPLLNSAGHCLGALAIMDLVPRTFTTRDIELLELTARWSMSEFERNRLVKAQNSIALAGQSAKATFNSHGMVMGHEPISLGATLVPDAAKTRPPQLPSAIPSSSQDTKTHSLKIELLSQLTQELRTPLTSVMGMASVLNREVYGSLTNKQKEYLGIIHQSGQYLLSLVNEIVELGSLEDGSQSLNLTSVDVEMLCQQAINTLEQAANRRDQEIRLTIEPGYRIWLLDKNKVRQMLYHLIFSVIQASNAGSIVRVHVSRKQSRLNLAIWVSHPWLGESLPHAELYNYQPAVSTLTNGAEASAYSSYGRSYGGGTELAPEAVATDVLVSVEEADLQTAPPGHSRENLGLVLSRHLAEMHGGQITIQGSPESGYRYVIVLPQLQEMDEEL